jgi:hypothetical protein
MLPYNKHESMNYLRLIRRRIQRNASSRKFIDPSRRKRNLSSKWASWIPAQRRTKERNMIASKPKREAGNRYSSSAALVVVGSIKEKATRLYIATAISSVAIMAWIK